MKSAQKCLSHLTDGKRYRRREGEREIERKGSREREKERERQKTKAVRARWQRALIHTPTTSSLEAHTKPRMILQDLLSGLRWTGIYARTRPTDHRLPPYTTCVFIFTHMRVLALAYFKACACVRESGKFPPCRRRSARVARCKFPTVYSII